MIGSFAESLVELELDYETDKVSGKDMMTSHMSRKEAEVPQAHADFTFPKLCKCAEPAQKGRKLTYLT